MCVAALAYGIYKQDLPEEKEAPRQVVFVDVGHTALQCCLASFHKGKLRVKAYAFDANLGGRDLDRTLFEHFVADIATRFKLDVRSHPKAAVRLLVEAEKLKKLTSADTVDHATLLECFINDRDVPIKINRYEHTLFSC